MKGQRVGYVRVSSFDQNPERQLEHVQVDRMFTDKASHQIFQTPIYNFGLTIRLGITCS